MKVQKEWPTRAEILLSQWKFTIDQFINRNFRWQADRKLRERERNGLKEAIP